MGFKSLHAKLNKHYKSMELKEKEEENDEKHVKKLFRKNQKIKRCLLTLDLKPFRYVKGKHSADREFHSLVVRGKRLLI